MQQHPGTAAHAVQPDPVTVLEYQAADWFFTLAPILAAVIFLVGVPAFLFATIRWIGRKTG